MPGYFHATIIHHAVALSRQLIQISVVLKAREKERKRESKRREKEEIKRDRENSQKI